MQQNKDFGDSFVGINMHINIYLKKKKQFSHNIMRYYL